MQLSRIESSRVERKVSSVSCFHGLISSIKRKNGWQLAEQACCENPYAFQYLLGRATQDVNHLRDSVRQYSIDFMLQTLRCIAIVFD